GATHADPGEHTDSAVVTTVAPVVSKTVFDTSLNTTANDNSEAVIGELITYELTIEIPEGELDNVRIVDRMDDGLAFVNVTSVTASPSLTSSAGDLANLVGIVTDPGSGPDNGNAVSFGFGATPGLGTLTNSNTDNAATETITIQYTAVVLNVAGNDNGDTLNNSADFVWNVNGSDQTVSDQASDITILEADLDVTKTVSNSAAETDETITYTFTVANNSSVEAYDIVFTDVLPAEIKNSVNLQVTAGETPTSLTLDAGGPEGTINGSWASLGVGESTTFTIDVTVDTGLNVNTTVSNVGDISWTSLPGDPGVISSHNIYSEERSGDTSDPNLNPQNDYRGTDNADFTIPTPVGGKSIIDTSEGHTDNDNSGAGQVNAVPGEVVRYEITIDLPQGNMNNLSLIDTLEDGLLFLDPAVNNVTIQINGFDPGGTTYTAGDLPANVHTAPQALDAGRITVAGQVVTFDFGQFTNNEADSAGESLTIAYNVIVSNDDGTNVFRGNDLTNSVQVQVNGVDSGPPAAIDTNVIQPQVTISKSDNGVTVADAGDIISYTLTITADSNINAATAFDLIISDTVPDELELDIASLTFANEPAYMTGVTASVSSAGQIITANVDRLDVGDSFEITFDATLRDSGVDQIASGETIENTATLTYSSLPGSGTADGSGDNTTGSAADTPDTVDGERVYTDSDSDDFTSPDPAVSKVLADPADTTYTIGETLEYVITLTLPEGQTDNVVLVDVLEAGMSYVGGTLTVTPGAGVTSSTAAPYDDTNAAFYTRTAASATVDETLQFNFGTLRLDEGAAGDGLGTQTVEIRYFAIVDNIVDNQDSTVRSNIVDLNWTDGHGVNQITSDSTPDSDTDITIVEPDLSVTKTITNDVSGLDAGDTVLYQIEVLHTPGSTADAFDIDLSDTLPSGILNNLTLVSATIDAADVSAQFAIVGNNLSNTGNIDLAQDEVLTITISGLVDNDASPGDLVSNTANLTWTGLDGIDSGERDGSDGEGGIPNDYADSDTVTTTVQGVLDITKTIPSGDTEVLIDGTIGYQLQVTIAEGTLPNLSIIDTLPANVTLVPGSVIISDANGMTINDFTVSPVVAQQFSITATSVVNPSDSNNSSTVNGDSFFITYSVTVDDVPANSNTDILTNSANGSADGVPDDDDNEASITVAEPVLQLQKDLTGATTGDAGDVFDYTFTINHDPTSLADAQDVILQDVIPTGFQLVPGSITAVGATPDPDSTVISGTGSAGDTITLRWETIPETILAGNAYEVTLQFTLVDTITDLDPNIINSATLDYDQDPDD
ncbi:MAG: isopeptide-forming domain-containing fimbrial protein, partial [Verrucomicrobiales bacterium]|nr:isopeptide-forming domain-containing fimbrial protein [Verrucomicrobiales bacterium]